MILKEIAMLIQEKSTLTGDIQTNRIDEFKYTFKGFLFCNLNKCLNE